MSPVLDALVLFLVLLPAIVLIALIIHSAMPWLSKSWRDAEERAELLIRSLLTEEDYRKLRRDGYLDIPSFHHCWLQYYNTKCLLRCGS